MNKIKYIFLYLLMFILIFISIIMLEEEYKLGSYILVLSCILPAFTHGFTNSLDLYSLGMGLTRKDLFKKYGYSLINLLIISLVLIISLYIFSLIVYKDTSLDIIILLMIFSLILSASIGTNLSANINKILAFIRFLVLIITFIILIYLNYYLIVFILSLIDVIICIILDYYVLKKRNISL